ACLERRNGDRQLVACDQVGEHHVFGAEARRLHDAAEVFGGGRSQHVDRVREARLVAIGLARVEVDRAHMAAPACTKSSALVYSSPAGRANKGRGSRGSPW